MCLRLALDFRFVGSARTELARAILGLDRLTKGKVIIFGKECKNVIENAIKFKIGYVPEDRKTQGLLLNMKVLENVSIVTLKNLFSKSYFIKKKDEERVVKKILNRLEVKTPDYSLLVKNLPGGN